MENLQNTSEADAPNMLETGGAGSAALNPANEIIDNSEELKSAARLNGLVQDEGQTLTANIEPAAEVVLVDPVTALSEMLEFVPFALDMADYKNAAAVWDKPVIQHLSERTVKVLQKYAFGQKIVSYLSKGGIGVDEAMLFMAVYELGDKTYQSILIDKQNLSELANKKQAHETTAGGVELPAVMGSNRE